MPRFAGFLLSLPVLLLPLAMGCGPSGGGSDSDFKLGDLVPAFEAPTLEALEAKVEETGGWIEMPVIDSLQLLRERQAGETPLATVAEALELRNNTPEDNDKILSAIGRLPQSDAAVKWNGSLTRHSVQSFRNANPVLLSTTTEFEVGGLINTGLFSCDWNFEPFAAKEMVESWDSSKDGMYDKIVMRDDITWSDGRPLTGTDLLLVDWNTEETAPCCGGRVLRIDPATGAYSVIVTANPTVSGNADPYGIALGPGGAFGDDIYVTDYQGFSTITPSLFRVDSNGDATQFVSEPQQ